VIILSSIKRFKQLDAVQGTFRNSVFIIYLEC